MERDKQEALEQIGNLFYAIAIEQEVSPLEVPELKLMISRDWIRKNLSEEFIVSDATHCIVMTIDANMGARLSPNEAFDLFVNFFHDHSTMFTKEIRDLLLKTANDIAKKLNGDRPVSSPKITALKSLLDVTESEAV